MKIKRDKKQEPSKDIIVGSTTAYSPKKRKVLIAIIIAIILVTFSSIVAYRFFFAKDENSPVPQFDRAQFDKDASEKESSSSLAESRSIAIEDAKLDPELQQSQENSLLNEAQQAAAEGNFNVAIDKLNQYITEKNGAVSYTVYIDLGLYYKRVNNPELAKVAYEKAAETAKSDQTVQEEIESILKSIELSARGL
jgi:flagellar basal body-associated protein FliL